MVKHSFTPEWWQGYHCLLPVTRNPYSPKNNALHADHQTACEDWDDGWHTRFYGEGVYEGHHDP